MLSRWLAVMFLFGLPATVWPAEERWSRPEEIFERSARSFDDQPVGLSYSSARMMQADDPRFAERDWDDSAWPVTSYQNLPARTGIYWVRFRVRLQGPQLAFDDALHVTTAAAYRIYWDGVLLGSSGAPGATPDVEVVGPLDRLHTLPLAARQPGEHVVALQMSAYKNYFPEARVRLLIYSGPAEALKAKLLFASASAVIGAAALLMLAASSWLIWLAGVRIPALGWFGAMCTMAAVFQAVLAARFVVEYPYSWAYPLILVRSGLLGGVGLALVMFVAQGFEPRLRRWIMTVMLVALVGLIIGYRRQPGEMGVALLVTSFFVALVLAIWVAWHSRARTDWLIVGGVAIVCGFGVVSPRKFGQPSFFPQFLPLELCLMGVLTGRVRAERRRARDMQLHSARLEIELLKKNLQPHFLFNTLAALTEVIEQQPSVAVELVNDLAEEFRVLVRLSGEKLVPLVDELSLCNTHLRVLSRRMAVEATLRTSGGIDGVVVPPAIFLTLIENAFAHQTAASDRVFSLRVTRVGEETSFRFFSPGEVRVAADRSVGGTGLRYVRARLEESFPDRWRFEQQAVAGGWETTIVVR